MTTLHTADNSVAASCMTPPFAWQPLSISALWPFSSGGTSGPTATDPYAFWAAAVGFRSFTANDQFKGPPGATWVSIIAKASSAQALKSLASDPPAAAVRWLYVPWAYWNKGFPQRAGLADSLYFTARVRVRDLWRLRVCKEIVRWELGIPAASPEEPGQPVGGIVRNPLRGGQRTLGAEDARRVQSNLNGIESESPVDWHAPDDLAQRGVIAVIDFGCAAFNTEFSSDAAGATSRLLCLWDQHQRRDADDPLWKRSFGFGYGSTVQAIGLDKLRANVLAQEPAADDGRLYEALGYLQERSRLDHPIKRRTHGTHVLAVVGGRSDPWAGVDATIAPDDAASHAWLHFTHLPIETAVDSSGGSLSVQVLDAVRDMLLRYPATTPIVVVLSQGTHAGPHDGTSLIEEALDELLGLRDQNFAVVIGAGNGRLDAQREPSGNHAVRHLAPGKDASLLLHLPEHDTTDTFVELWYERPKTGGVAFRLVPPRPFAPSEWVAADRNAVAHAQGSIYAGVMHLTSPPTGANAMALIAVSPTRATGAPSIPAGTWRIEMRSSGGASTQVHAWVERDDPLRGAKPDWPRFIGAGLSDASTLNTLANGRHTLVVGAMQFNNRAEAPYSAHGPALAGGGHGPHVLAVADENAATPGVRAAAVRSGESTRMSGTSVAAPTFARRLFNAMVAAPQPVVRSQMPGLVEAVLRANPRTTRRP